jgi:hypothetical protein
MQLGVPYGSLIFTEDAKQKALKLLPEHGKLRLKYLLKVLLHVAVLWIVKLAIPRCSGPSAVTRSDLR